MASNKKEMAIAELRRMIATWISNEMDSTLFFAEILGLLAGAIESEPRELTRDYYKNVEQVKEYFAQRLREHTEETL